MNPLAVIILAVGLILLILTGIYGSKWFDRF